jgi:hypothetical protein
MQYKHKAILIKMRSIPKPMTYTINKKIKQTIARYSEDGFKTTEKIPPLCSSSVQTHVGALQSTFSNHILAVSSPQPVARYGTDGRNATGHARGRRRCGPGVSVGMRVGADAAGRE